MKHDASSPPVMLARALGLVVVILLAGCQTPDVKPFAAASATVAGSINQGGELAVGVLAREPVLNNGQLVSPDDPHHPARQILAEWKARRKSADGILRYSAALAAIADAAGNRKASAAAVVNSVKELAQAVPGVGIGASAAGEVVVKGVVKGLETFVEVKAWRDMARAVRAADPAIKIIGEVLQADFATLRNTFTITIDEKLAAADNALRRPDQLFNALKDAQRGERSKVQQAPAEKERGAELGRIDALLAGVEPEVNRLRAELERLYAAREDGVRFFDAAISAIDAWAAAHADVADAFEQKRPPNLALLFARAEELRTFAAELKSTRATKS